jgi:hypothetical protein
MHTGENLNINWPFQKMQELRFGNNTEILPTDILMILVPEQRSKSIQRKI